MDKKDDEIRLYHTPGDVFRWRMFGLLHVLAPRARRDHDEKFRSGGEPIFLTYSPRERRRWLMRSPWARAFLTLESVLAVALVAGFGALHWREVVVGAIASWEWFSWVLEYAPTWFDDWLGGMQRSSSV